MKNIYRIIRGVYLIITKPGLFFERLHIHFNWVKYLLFKSPINKRINGVIFEFDFSLSPYIKSMYFGWYDSEVIDFMKNVLKPGDIFIDIGANIGYISANAAALVGKTGEVHSFEPGLPYYQRLEKFSRLNQDYKIIVNQCALGEEEKESYFLLSKENIGANIIVPNNEYEGTVTIPVRRFDTYAREKHLENIKLIKIDVECFEFSVLKGFQNYFNTTSNRPKIICEIFPHAYPRFGASLTDLLEYMRQYGYKTYSIYSPQREIDVTKLTKEDGYNVIFKSESSESIKNAI